ncbi:galactose mutarotase-like protein [Schizophyllum commune H4-8]|uniref:galactose mutarotase-like protein n=1 Tax=Schizophyllum commune (strain H4-8 / FGSC 9210) TaxID=578458 RepID=UPI0021605E68|nr:galactose mutarotase-like protein [Schizophyllum commune H4-8]KAI5888268.1 galactose mutarotase-like protein [Schizophyllum commune H4-8]
MFIKALLALGVVCASVSAQDEKWPFDVTTLTAPDGSVTAKFVSLGATLTELWVKDRDGNPRDVVLGYDDNSKLLTDPNHPSFNPIIGRYANRIKNGTFSIPITKDAQPDGPNVYHIPTNGQPNALHGGKLGWDRRNWTVIDKSPTHVSYLHFDPADEGFPGNVTTIATHTVHKGGILESKLWANATEKTPIMTTQHVYWNLDAFQNNSSDILSHHLQIAADKVIEIDSNQVPTGGFINVTGTPLDFTQEQPINVKWNDTFDLCGPECQGYDNCWIFTNATDRGARTSLWSDASGIRVDISSNQPATQVYTSNWLDIPRKVVHGGPDVNYTKWSAVAIEQQGYMDAINTPEWNIDQIHEPGKDFFWEVKYEFSTV